MKKIVSLTILLILFIQCISQKKSDYFDKRHTIIRAKIFKIEEKNNIYVYYFKNSTITGVFAKEKKCFFKTEAWQNIKLNRNYNLILHSPINANLRSGGLRESLNGELVWDSDMKETYYDDCKNICGNKIYKLK